METAPVAALCRGSELPESKAEAGLQRTVSSTTDKHYDYPIWRKCLIVLATSWMTLAATASSTSLFAASDEIASTFSTSVTKVNVSNAGVLLAMSISSFIWSPIGFIIGRRIAYNVCIIVMLIFTISAAVAPSFQAFAALRILSGLEGTFFHVAGQTILAEYFPPTQRGTATGFFLAGTVLGPPLGPCIAGIVVTFQNWRVILWLQAGMIGFGLFMSLLFLPYSQRQSERTANEITLSDKLKRFNPMRILKLISYPDVLFTDLTCGLLSWTQYSILAAPRQALSSQFQITSPLTTGLFYIAPAVGFLVGTIVGGRYSDLTVRKWIQKREGTRLPQDRLRSGMVAFFVIIPVASLIYGWCLNFSVGGIPLAAVSVFFVSVGLLTAFASINTYCSEVLPLQRIEVIAGKYFTQYIFGATASATIVPLFESIGIGPATTIGVCFVIVGGVLTFTTAKYGKVMHQWWEGSLEK